MTRRLTAFALVALLVSGGLTVCPSGICPMMRKAANDCCTKGAGIKRPDCCPAAAAERAPASLVSTAAAERFGAALMWLGPDVSLPTSLTVRAAGTMPALSARGPSPPASLFTQQTSLLL